MHLPASIWPLVEGKLDSELRKLEHYRAYCTGIHSLILLLCPLPGILGLAYLTPSKGFGKDWRLDPKLQQTLKVKTRNRDNRQCKEGNSPWRSLYKMDSQQSIFDQVCLKRYCYIIGKSRALHARMDGGRGGGSLGCPPLVKVAHSTILAFSAHFQFSFKANCHLYLMPRRFAGCWLPYFVQGPEEHASKLPATTRNSKYALRCLFYVTGYVRAL